MKDNLNSIGILWLRVLAGTGIAYHGYGKVFGGNMAKMTEGVGALGFPSPELFAWAAALSEFAGGILLVIGAGTHYAAAFIFITMSVAAFMQHAKDPFGVKELALAYWTASGALIFSGGGKFSLDRYIFKNK